jgi:hypothetical protein
LLPTTLLTPQDILRGRGSELAEEGGGVIAWLADGVEGSARNVANVTNNGKPGELLTFAPGPVPDLGVELDGMVELGRATIDCVGGGVGTDFTILDVTASGLFVVGPTAMRVALLNVTGFVSAPSLSLGANAGFDDQAPTTLLLGTTQDGSESVALLQPRPVLRAGDVLAVQLDVLAVATTYQVEVVVYGFHRIP